MEKGITRGLTRRILSLMVWLMVVWATSGMASYSLQNAPASWVDDIAFSIPADSDGTGYRTDIEYYLVDVQVFVDAETEAEYRHYVYEIRSFAGVQNHSSVEMQYDPTYQQLDIHRVDIHRDKKTINCIPVSKIETIQREPEMDRQLFDGRQSVMVFLADVRPGDIIEYAYTVSGKNPVLTGHYCDRFRTSWRVPVKDYHFKLNWQQTKPLYHRLYNNDTHNNDTHNSVTQVGVDTTDDGTVYSLSLTDLPARVSEDNIPSWYLTGSWLEFSDFAQWEDMVKWAVPLYENAVVDDPEFESFIARWQEREFADQMSRVAAILQFVQDEIRYLGIEMGDHSLVPHSPHEILKQRFGDCKDKSLLLAATLNRLGIEAYPALVSTVSRHAVETYLPSVMAFNHVIVKMVVDGTECWVDPTRSYQRGKLDGFQHPDFRRALVIDAGVTELASFQSDNPTTVQFYVKETFTFSPGSDSVILDVETQFKGMRANSLRYDLACESKEERERSYLNFYDKAYPGIKAIRPIEIEDNQRDNIITHTEQYTIPDFDVNLPNEYAAWAIKSNISEPHYQNRNYPFAISHPVYVMHRIELVTPTVQSVKPEKLHIQNDRYEFKYKQRKTKNSLIMFFDYSTFTDHIEVDNLKEYLTDVRRINRTCDFIPKNRTLPKLRSVLLLITVFAGVIIALIAIAVKILSSDVRTGQESMVGMSGVVSRPVSADQGMVFVHGELWQARTHENGIIPERAAVTVFRVDGLVLFVTSTAISGETMEDIV